MHRIFKNYCHVVLGRSVSFGVFLVSCLPRIIVIFSFGSEWHMIVSVRGASFVVGVAFAP